MDLALQTDLRLHTDPLVRAARAGERRSWLRFAVSAVVAYFLFHYLGLIPGAIWLALTFLVEALHGVARRRLLAGDIRFRRLSILCMGLISLAWVSHAVMMWRVGGELPRIVAIIDLLTVSLYAAIGAHYDRRLLAALLAPPLATLSILLIGVSWQSAPAVPAIFYTIATLGAVATIAWNAIALHQSDRELNAANLSLEEAMQAARQANAAKDQFLSNMSHELRTPLNGIIGIGAALSNAPLPERERDMARLIKISGETLERLVSDLLDLARMEAGKLNLQPERFELGDLVRASAGLHRTAAQDRGLAFDIDISPAAEAAYVGDSVRLGQIITNLVSNAVKFTLKGGIRIEADAGPEGVVLSVTDTGIGFDDETGARLFQRFEQADSSITRRFGGTGLGLSICRALCEGMGGEIAVRSSPGEGSRFDVRLPLPRAPEASVPTPGTTPAPTAMNPETLRILLAEDHEINRRTLAYMLEEFGVALTLAADGREALEAYLEGDYDVVLMDMQMPVMDGLAASRAIREAERQTGRARTPIIMLTANAMDEHIAQAMDAGCNMHIAKPITPERLFKGLNAVLAQAAA